MRVFCDFSIFKGTYYAFLGSLKEGETLHNTGHIKEIQYRCAQIGLEPVSIEKSSQIETIRKYIENIGIKLKDTAIVMGYDYACDIKECTKEYKSLTDANTKDISTLLRPYIDMTNIKNSPFAQKGRIDAIGFNYDKGMMSYFRLRDKAVKGIICSDNAFDTSGGLIKLTCKDSVRSNVKLQAGLHSNMAAVCPKECADKVEFNIYGSTLYRDDSSICRAAVHSGQIDDTKGGVLYIGIE